VALPQAEGAGDGAALPVAEEAPPSAGSKLSVLGDADVDATVTEIARAANAAVSCCYPPTFFMS